MQKKAPVPAANATTSYWRSHVSNIDRHRTTESLPQEADIVIVGAGYSGASITHHLIELSLQSGRPVPSIVILEAREACSGATGRNGGHLKPDPFSRAATVLQTHGLTAAEDVTSFEARHVDEIENLVQRLGIACDFERTRVTDVCLYAAGRDKIMNDLEQLAKAGMSTVHEVGYYTDSKAVDVSGVKCAKLCLTYEAARLWPYRLVSALLERAVSQGVNLQTETPVDRVDSADSSAGGRKSIVNTPRGFIRCSTVLYATNGYSAALLPELHNKIVPVKGMVAHLIPKDGPRLTESYMLRQSEYEYDYMINRPDGSIIVGGARRDFYHDLDQWFNVSDDSSLIEGARQYFDGYMQRHFEGWDDVEVETSELWTGIMGYSNDGFPYVGPVPNKSGRYICAGFSGHGMPQIFLSAKAVAEMVVSGTDPAKTDLPLPYLATPERWYKEGEHISLQTWRTVSGVGSNQAQL